MKPVSSFVALCLCAGVAAAQKPPLLPEATVAALAAAYSPVPLDEVVEYLRALESIGVVELVK